MLFLHASLMENDNPFLAHFSQGKWQCFSCTLSREMAILVLLTCFKGNGNHSLANLFQVRLQYIPCMLLIKKWKYFSCTLLSWKMAIHMLFLQAPFKENGNTFPAYFSCTLLTLNGNGNVFLKHFIQGK